MSAGARGLLFRVEEHGAVARIRMASTWFGRSLHEVSAYAVGELLVDCGPPPAARRLVHWCRRRGIRRVVVTHHHEDHVGAAAALVEELGVRLEAPAAAVPMLASGLRMPLYRRLIWGRPRPVEAEALPPVVEAAGLRLRVVPTPGHAVDHVCLHAAERDWLFTGDLWVHPRVRQLRRVESVGDHLDSLRRVAGLAPRTLWCAHAGRVEEGEAALAEKIAFWEELGRRCRELAAAGWSVRRIARSLLGREGAMHWLSLGDFSKRNLVRSLLAAGEQGGPGARIDSRR